MKATTKIIMATDGGAIQYKGSFGFILTTFDSMVLLSCYRQLAGFDPLSFRSKACAFLAATRLIFLIAEHYDELIVDAIDISCKVHLYTNSMSMIKKLDSMDAYPTAHLKYVIGSEWDILQALQTLMKKNTVPGDAPAGKTIWNSPNELTQSLKKHTTNELSIKTWVSNDEESNTVTSGNSEENSSQESDPKPSATPRLRPSQKPTREPTTEPRAEPNEDPRWVLTQKPIPIPKPNR